MDNPASDPVFLTARELATLLRVKERKVYDLAAAGEIPCLRVTGKLLFPRRQIEGWIARATPEGATPEGATPEGSTPESGPPETVKPRDAASRRPGVVVGSHDPLLEWALRASGCGLPSLFDGSLDGLARIARDEAAFGGIHLFDPETASWNEPAVRSALPADAFVLITWAHRRQGLIVAAAAADSIADVGGLRGRRVALRQPASGARQLFLAQLREAGLGLEDLEITTQTARTEAEIAEMVAMGPAEAGFGLGSMARRFGLAFIPLVEERFDLVVDRHAYFEAPFQRLLTFCRSPEFAARAAELGGYDISESGCVAWSGSA